MIRRHQRERWDPEVYDFLDDLLTVNPQTTAEDLLRGLNNRFAKEPPPRGLPTDARTVRTWKREGRIGPRGDVWTLSRASAGDAVHVLPVLSAYRERALTQRAAGEVPPALLPLGMDEVAALVRIGEVLPGLSPLARLDLARTYILLERHGHPTLWLDHFIADILSFQAWTTGGARQLWRRIAGAGAQSLSVPEALNEDSIDVYRALAQRAIEQASQPMPEEE